MKEIAERELRNPKASELGAIFMLGYDAWSDGAAVEVYLDGCQHSEKYQQGTWHVLLSNAVIVSALILYRQGFNLPAGSVGIGSVATSPLQRHKGYASELVNRVLQRLDSQGTATIVLFSDIDPAFYEKMGFSSAAHETESGFMIRQKSSDRLLSVASIAYF